MYYRSWRLGVGVGIPALCGLYLLAKVQHKRWSDSHTWSSATYHFCLNQAMVLTGKMARAALEKDLQDFQAVQSELLLQLLQEHKDTAYGKDHGYKDLHSVADFRNKLPLTYYQDYLPYISRIASGESNVMTSLPVRLLGATSGTSGHKSLLPHTSAISTRFFKSGVANIFHSMFTDAFPDALQCQRTCKITFKARWQYTEAGGPNRPGLQHARRQRTQSTRDSHPGHMHSFDRLLALYSTPKAGFHIPSEQPAMYAHALFALKDANLGQIESNFAPSVPSFLNFIVENQAELIQDIAMGRADGLRRLGTEEVTVRELETAMSADPARAAALRQAFAADAAQGKGELVTLLWPRLNLFLTVTTGSFAPYASGLRERYDRAGIQKWHQHICNDETLKRVQIPITQNTHGICAAALRERFDRAGKVPIYSPVFAATEGLMGVNLEPRSPSPAYTLVKEEWCSRVTVPRAMFFEFLPVEEQSEATAPTTLLAHQVGSEYELVVTNLAGLVRYRIGDVVRVKGFHQQVYLLIYLQGQLAAAVASTASRLGFQFADFSSTEYVLVDQAGALPRYHLFLEPLPATQDNARVPTSDDFDSALQQASAVYASYRAKGAIAAPVVHMLPEGTFKDFLQHLYNSNQTGSLTQLKIPRVLKLREHVRFLLEKEV
eukprot:g18783.t1